MAKIVGDAKKCAACLICQMVCSNRLFGEFNPSKTPINIIFGEDGNPCDIAFTDECELCGICAPFCPRGAIEILK